MNDSLLLGWWKHMVRIPSAIWQRLVSRSASSSQARLSFMSEDHHKIRDFVVLELPKSGVPLSPDWIASRVNLPLARTLEILDELEKHMTFLFRNEQGEVVWAYPVTVEPTPHHITFQTGEQVYAAWGIDAIATPFVQGQLRIENLSCWIETSCAHCGQQIHIQLDSQLHYIVEEADANPLVFVPMVDFEQLEDPSIIDAFWRKSVFFWSEEHGKAYQQQHLEQRGTFMTLEQAIYVTPKTQGALFNFPRQVD